MPTLTAEREHKNTPTDIYGHTITRSENPEIVSQSLEPLGLTKYAKIVVDMVGALFGIVILSPLSLLIALAIKLDDGGPILFKQIRVGKNGKTFVFYKFRTMNVEAEDQKKALKHLNDMSGPVFKISNDPRVTRIGRFLRRTSMDELPQFYNVLKGDMSLVGPRPPLPSEVEQYDAWQCRRLCIKPGITCLWQVNGRNNIDFDKWVKLDLEYIDNWSLWLDFKIITKTIPAILKGDGAS